MLDSYRTISHCHYKSGQYDKAVEYEYLVQEKLKKQGDEAGIASSLTNIARIYESGFQYGKAVSAAREAGSRFKALGQQAGAISASLLLGKLYLESNQYQQALDHLLAELESYQQGLAEKDLATAFQFAGFAFEKLGNYTEALMYQHRALEIFQKLGEKAMISQCYQYLVNNYWYRGEYSQALNYQNRALAIIKALGDQRQEILAYSTSGLIYLSIAQLDQALKMEEQALLLARKINARDEMAAAYNNMGLVYRQMGKEQKALKFFQRALKIDQAVGSDRGQGYDYRNIGITYERLGNLEQALACQKKALAISRKIKNPENEAKVLYSLGTIYSKLKKDQPAAKNLESALALSQKLGIREIEWRALRKLGQIYEAGNKYQQAEDTFDKGIGVIEEMRSQLKIEKYKTGFMDDKLDVYQDMIMLLVKSGKVEKAFDYVERAKSRNFIDLLGNQQISVKNTASTQLLQQERDLKRTIENLFKALFNAVDKAEKETLARQLKEQKREYENLLLKMEEESPELASLVSVKPAAVKEIQSYLSGDMVLLEYFTTPDHLLVWMVDRKGIALKKVPLKNSLLISQINKVRKGIKKISPVDPWLKKLYSELIEPVAGKIKGAKKLCIVPHGALHYLPFAALQDKQGKYLIDHYACFSVPSASVLRYCMGRESRPTLAVLAVANPDLANPGFDLPFAQKEVESIIWNYPDSKAFFREEATETRVRNNTSGYQVIHFACHGEFDRENPLFSGLLLSMDEANDGRLEVHEIFGLDLDASLVTLSACETGLGKIEKGDDVVGLTRAFIYAGASSIIASLWKISDVASAVLIKRFYRYLQGQDKIMALHQAQLLVKKRYKHPAYWASFVLTGDYR